MNKKDQIIVNKYTIVYTIQFYNSTNLLLSDTVDLILAQHELNLKTIKKLIKYHYYYNPDESYHYIYRRDNNGSDMTKYVVDSIELRTIRLCNI